MNQILSQNEVEALLRAVGEGGLEPVPDLRLDVPSPVGPVPTRSVVSTDRRFEDVRPMLEEAVEATMRSLRSFLLSVLARELTLERAPLELVFFQDYSRRYDLSGRPYTFMPFELEPDGRAGLLVCEPALALALVEGFMGGTLEGEGTPVWRVLTTLELRVAERICRELISSLSTALQARTTMTLKPLPILTNVHLIKGVRELGAMVAASFRILVRGRVLGECMVLMPLEAFEARQNAEKDAAISSLEQEKWEKTLRDGLSQVELVVTAELGSLKMSVSRLVGLKVGELLPLEGARPGEALVRVEGVPKLKAIPGIYHGRKALRVTQEI